MTTPPPGPRVLAGRYELQRLLGRGGAGAVWQGMDTRLGRPVAVKLVRIPSALDGHDQAETRRRVMREARAAARLDHPAAVTMYDVLETDDELCLVMELVEAPDLGKLVAEDGPLPPAEAARIGLDVLDALEAAHRRGLVHRDVKPSNVMVPADGPARLTDFGTAVIAGEDRLTATGMVFGSPAYMAPEQAVDVGVGPAADLWALGATLYQAVEGVPPFSGPTPLATMHAVMHDDPRPTELADGLRHVIDRLLVRDPSVRADAAETRELLHAVAGHRTALLPTATAGPGSPDADARGASAAVDAVVDAAPTPDDLADDGWASSPVSRRRGGGRSKTSVLLLAGVAALLIAAGVLAWIAGQDRDPAIPVADETSSADAAQAPAVAPTPAPTPTLADAGEPTPSPPEVQDDEQEGEGDADGEQESQDEDAPGQDDQRQDDQDQDDRDQGTEGQGQVQGNQGEGNQGVGNQGEGDQDQAGGDDAAVAALPAATVPEDWVAYEPDDAPFVLARPPQWTVERLDATRTDIADPASSAYLRLDWTDDPAPDPVADWEAYEPQFAAGRDGYERVRMEPTTFKGESAALWEYRYARGGVTYHAYNLNVSGGEYGYALNFQTREEEWAQLSPLFSAFAESYTIPG